MSFAILKAKYLFNSANGLINVPPVLGHVQLFNHHFMMLGFRTSTATSPKVIR